MNANATSERNLYFLAKNSGLVYNVVENEDGNLFITLDGVTSIPNAGLFIRNLGGVDALKARCVRDSRSFEEIKRDLYERKKVAKQAAMERAHMRNQEEAAEAECVLEALIANSEDSIIEVTIDNIRVVARYLLTSNCGMWQLPKMSVGYTANQYDSGAITMTFDRPIDVQGDMENKFVFKARPNELSSYKHMRL
jgi:hypothetical protein